jgi:hypothetical protein
VIIDELSVRRSQTVSQGNHRDLPQHGGQGIAPNPEDKITPSCEKGIRSNRFQSFMGCERIKELLCVGKYSEWNDYPPLKISFQDLFRFWWNRCVVQEYVVDEIPEDIFSYFTDLIRPLQKEEPQMDLTLDFEQVPLIMEKTVNLARFFD